MDDPPARYRLLWGLSHHVRLAQSCFSTSPGATPTQTLTCKDTMWHRYCKAASQARRSCNLPVLRFMRRLKTTEELRTSSTSRSGSAAPQNQLAWCFGRSCFASTGPNQGKGPERNRDKSRVCPTCPPVRPQQQRVASSQ